jgi:CRISPR/Cas system-associated exonuclease Cas4 (RecB family)
VPQHGFHCIVDLEDVSFEACIACAATLGRCHLTASLLRGMADQARERNADDAVRFGTRRGNGRLLALPIVGGLADGPGQDDAEGDEPAIEDADALTQLPSIPALSVTALTCCVRQSFLKTTVPYHQRPDQQYWSYRGTLGHLLAERGAGPDTVAEQRFERELLLPSGRRVTITGKPDEIDPPRSLLIDYKTTDRAPKLPSPLHIAQLNVYRWLVVPEYQIERLGIVYLTMKGVQKASVPVWPEGQVERFLQERAGALADAYAGGAWPSMTEDRWMCNFCPVAAVCERGQMQLAAS